jgi:hypothetical protein
MKRLAFFWLKFNLVILIELVCVTQQFFHRKSTNKKAFLNKSSVQTSSFASPVHVPNDQTCSGDYTVSNYLNDKEEFEFYAYVPLIESHLLQFALNG